jgi:DUF1680 family protein
LASLGKQSRKEWFGTACCPSNIARLIASLGNFIYGYADNKIFINLFVGSQTNFSLPKGEIQFNMQTNYPWSGDVKCTLSMKKKIKSTIAFRIPGWSKGIPAPGELYAFSTSASEKPIMLINKTEVPFIEQDGYAIIDREWSNNDVIEYKIPMNIKKVVARNELKYNNERIALQRGPLVYCIEGADNNGKAWNVVAPTKSAFETENFSVLDEKVVSLIADLPVLTIASDGLSAKTSNQKVRAIPYYTWCNRGSNPMQIWLPVSLKDVKINY